MALQHTAETPRRRFITSAIAMIAAATGTRVHAQQVGGIRGFDHVALPMQNTDAMLAFYRGLGFDMAEAGGGVAARNLLEFMIYSP